MRLRPCAQAAARQPVGEPVEIRWTAQWTHPPTEHHLGDALCRSAGSARRDPFRGPAVANDDGRAAEAEGRAASAPTVHVRRTAPRSAIDVGELAAARSATGHPPWRPALDQL